MKAFNNDPELKQQLIDMAAQHRKADEYLKGTYGDTEDGKFRACSIGCTIHDVNIIHGKNLSTDSHTALAKELDIPEFIFGLQDSIFEGLPEPLNIEWTERIFNAIPVGKDLTPVLPRFLLKILDRLPDASHTDVVASVKQVREVLQNWSDTGKVDVAAARAARASTEAAEGAWAVAWAAARAAAEGTAGAAAWAAAWAAAEGAAWAAWEQIADDLIECIEDLAH